GGRGVPTEKPLRKGEGGRVLQSPWSVSFAPAIAFASIGRCRQAVLGSGEAAKGLRHLAWRTISTASRRQFENKVPEKQKLFQEDNGIPVHLKGGIADALLYRATMILTVGGTAYAIYQLAVASFPKKQD
uniref:Cytochrome c oxidase subunit 7A2, mitochondrial n=1 Tax=Equus asinus TaxID=9793 RepID=A0A9L0IRL3_EQUAS